MKTILVTGAAGFIGYHLCEKLIKAGYRVLGLDNINDYYDVNLKYARLKQLGIEREKASVFHQYAQSVKYGDQLQFIRMNLENQEELPKVFQLFNFDQVINLAAQAGVRYSLENPMAYVESNILGFVNILECCRSNNITNFIYASSSSVYGNSAEVPFLVNAKVDKPISLYAATKKSNELIAYTYSHLYSIQTIGLRFFTVYGPWGRPDMSYFLFADSIYNRKSIKVYNNGDMSRDFTYIDDIINGISLVVKRTNHINMGYKIYNIGNSKPTSLIHFIECIEESFGVQVEKNYLPIQPGDVLRTWADISELSMDTGYTPQIEVKKGVEKFAIWFKNYYKQ